jgi:alkaline phosphatase D
VYDAQIFGPAGERVQIILLDTRYFRSPLKEMVTRRPGEGRYVANRDTNATLLGEAQWTWLEQQLRKPAELRLLVSSIQVIGQDHNWEKWMNFPHERARLYRLIHDTGARSLIVLTGDRHHAELNVMRSALVGYPLYDLTSSGLNMTHDALVYEPSRHRVGRTIVKENNFGVVDVDWSEHDPLVTLEIRSVSVAPPVEPAPARPEFRDAGSRVLIRQEIRLSELQPPPP